MLLNGKGYLPSAAVYQKTHTFDHIIKTFNIFLGLYLQTSMLWLLWPLPIRYLILSDSELRLLLQLLVQAEMYVQFSRGEKITKSFLGK